jgi:hypothetical protein
MRCFTPPADENWRMVRAVSEAERLRIDWFPPDALATTWNLAMRSVVACRDRSGRPDVHEALAIGLLPAAKDIRATLHLSGEHRESTRATCSLSGSTRATTPTRTWRR